MTLSESITSLVAKVQDNPRLRLGVFLIIGMFWLYGLLVLRDESRLAATEYQTVAKKVVRLQAEAKQTEWATRVEPVLALQLDLESRMWREGTIGLAQATFQDWLNQAVQQSNLVRAVVSVAAQEDNAQEKNTAVKTLSAPNPDIWKVSAKIGFDFTPKGLYALIGRLEGNDKQIIVESLVVRTTPSPRADMVLVAYFQKPSGAEKAIGANNGNTTGVRP